MATITGRTVSPLLPAGDTPPGSRAIPERPDEPSRAEIGRAVPAASRRIRGQREALRAGLGYLAEADVRADFRANLASFWRIHVNHCSWGGPSAPPRGTSQPTRARVCELADISISTYKACRRWWEARGFLAIVRRGWTPALRPAALVSPEDHNERQVYVLCIPREHRCAPAADEGQTITRPLTWSRRDLVRNPAHARSNPSPSRAPERSRAALPWPLRGVSDGWWVHLTRPFAVAGWSHQDLMHAINHDPGGRQHRHRLENVRRPAGWLAWRLGLWRAPDGSVLTSKSARLAAAAAARRPLDPATAARAVQLRQAAAAAARPGETTDAGQLPANVQLARLRTRLGRALGPRWRDPAEIAAQQAAEARAARAAAPGPA